MAGRFLLSIIARNLQLPEQGFHELSTTRKAIVGLFGQRFEDGFPIRRRQTDEVGNTREVLHDQLSRVGSVERPLADQHFHVDDGQTILVALAAHPPIERFGRGIHRRDATRYGCTCTIEVLGESKVRDLDMATD